MLNTEPDTDMTIVHVAVGVIVNRQREILIAKRLENQHQGGLWEFPGGKVKRDEKVQDALKRELKEEVNITVRECASLMRIEHDYGDKQVLLDVWYVNVYSGDAKGCEGQEVAWIKSKEFPDYAFPAANKAIIESVTNLLRSPGN
jgi:8-oxo-dGTP diphosphatase